MTALRILIATDQWFPDQTGGSARVAAETARRLADRGHAVTVLAPRVEGHPREELLEGVRLIRALWRTALPQTLTDVAGARAAARLVGPVDVILAHQPTVALGASSALPGVPLVSVFHASPALEARYFAARRAFTSRGLAARLLVPVLAQFERAAIRRSTRVLVLSDYSGSLTLERFTDVESRLVRVSGGVDVDWFSPGDGPQAARDRLGPHFEGPLLFTARRLEPRMGLDVLLDALRRLGTARLALAGSGSLEKALRAQADELGIADRIVVLGHISDEALRDWYRAADVVVMPTSAYEGFGLTTVEALACGTPVVGTRVGATPELLEPLDRSLLAGVSDAESLATTIAVTLGRLDANFRERCREYAVDRFAWEQAVPHWEEALAAAAGERTARLRFLGAPLDPVRLDEAVDLVDERTRDRRPLRHASLNAAKLVRLRHDRELAHAIESSGLVTADGQPVVWAARLAGHQVPERVAGIDLMEALLARAEERDFGIYLLGAQADVVAEAAAEMSRRHPRLRIVGTRDGYFTRAEEPGVVEAIRAAAPDILFVALGSPQKELFQARNGDLGVPFTMGVGGAFDVLAGRARRAPRWARTAGLEWAFRLAQEPRRLLVRYLVGNAVFIALAGREIARARLGRATARVAR